MIQGDCFSWVFPVLTKHLDTIANLHLTILALTWGLISRRVLQSQSCECLDSGCKEPDKFTPEMIAGYGPVALEAQYYYLQVNRKRILRIIKRVVCMEY